MFTYLKGKPEIVYPCRWIYKLFGMNQEKMYEAVANILAGLDYMLTFSRSSRHKKYHCLNLDVMVSTEHERTEIYQALSSHQAFVLVL